MAAQVKLTLEVEFEARDEPIANTVVRRLLGDLTHSIEEGRVQGVLGAE